MTAKTRQRKRSVNYAELMRKTKSYHDYTFQPPVWNKNLSKSQQKKDLTKARNSKVIKNLWETGQVTADQIQKIIKRKAIDYNINRNLTPQQKSSINTQWYGTNKREDGTRYRYGLKNVIQHVETKDAQFVPIVHANRKEILKRMKRTNKGVFVFEKDVEITVKGRGKSLRLDIERTRKPEPGEQIFKRREIFFPFPKGVLIPEYVAYLHEKYKPNSVAIGVMSAHSNASYTNLSNLSYVWDTIDTLNGRGKSHPFSGVYFYFF